MTQALITSKAFRRHCIGGRELMVLEYDLPSGSAPAAMHFRQMVLALLHFAETTYLPPATAELQQAVGQQAIHRFFSYRYRVKLQKNVQKGLSHLMLSATLYRGNELLLQHDLDTVWEPTLSLQLPIDCTSKGKK